MPLVDLGDGGYQLEAGFTVGGNSPLRQVAVHIEQETSVGTHWVGLTRRVGVPGDPTAVLEEHTAVLPQAFTLSQNYPNPFNSTTVIHFALPTSEEVELVLLRPVRPEGGDAGTGTAPGRHLPRRLGRPGCPRPRAGQRGVSVQAEGRLWGTDAQAAVTAVSRGAGSEGSVGCCKNSLAGSDGFSIFTKWA